MNTSKLDQAATPSPLPAEGSGVASAQASKKRSLSSSSSVTGGSNNVTQLKVERCYPTRVCLRWNLYTETANRFAERLVSNADDNNEKSSLKGEEEHRFSGVHVSWRCSDSGSDGSETLKGLRYAHVINGLKPGTVVFAEVRLAGSDGTPISPGTVVKATTPQFLEAPQIINAEGTAASVALEWDFKSHEQSPELDVFEYEIEIKQMRTSETRRVFTGADTTAFALTRLMGNTEYSFRVRAHYTFWNRNREAKEFEHILARTISGEEEIERTDPDEDAYDPDARPNTVDSHGMIVSEFSEAHECATSKAGVVWKCTARSPLVCWVGKDDDEQTIFENPMAGGDYTLFVRNLESSAQVAVVIRVFCDQELLSDLCIGPLASGEESTVYFSAPKGCASNLFVQYSASIAGDAATSNPGKAEPSSGGWMSSMWSRAQNIVNAFIGSASIQTRLDFEFNERPEEPFFSPKKCPEESREEKRIIDSMLCLRAKWLSKAKPGSAVTPELRARLMSAADTDSDDNDWLHGYIGQHLAISALLQTELGGWAEKGGDAERKPCTVLLFSGPPGCGKTLLAQRYAKKLKRTFVHINMGRYRSKEDVSALIGASPHLRGGGKDDVNELLTPLRESAKRTADGVAECVVLLDEIEKADKSILSVLMEPFDFGSFKT